MKIAAESVRLAGELDRLERDAKVARVAVSQNMEPPRHEHSYHLEARHAALLQSYARALLREWLEGKPSDISWAPDVDEPLCQRRRVVVAAVQHQIAQWCADKAAGKPLPPAHDAPKFGDMIVDGLNQLGGVR